MCTLLKLSSKIIYNTNLQCDLYYVTVGAFVDELIHEPVSIAKAQRDGIRTAKFPIEKYVNWCQGSQLLPINQVKEISYY